MTTKTFIATSANLVIAGIDTAPDADGNPVVRYADHALNDHAADRHRSADEQLVTSMLTRGWFGVIEGVEQGEDVIITFGRRRLIAAREASARLIADGKQPLKITVDVKKREKRIDSMAKMVLENLGRQELTIVEKAKQAQALVDAGMKLPEVAKMFNRKAPTVKNWMKILVADEVLQEAAQSGAINENAAAWLATQPKRDQARATALTLKAGGTTTAARAVMKKLSAERKGKAPKNDEVKVLRRVSMAKVQATLDNLQRDGDADLLGKDMDTVVAMLQWFAGIDECPAFLDSYLPQKGRDADTVKDENDDDNSAQAA